jgi:hypothetical protein
MNSFPRPLETLPGLWVRQHIGKVAEPAPDPLNVERIAPAIDNPLDVPHVLRIPSDSSVDDQVLGSADTDRLTRLQVVGHGAKHDVLLEARIPERNVHRTPDDA